MAHAGNPGDTSQTGPVGWQNLPPDLQALLAQYLLNGNERALLAQVDHKTQKAIRPVGFADVMRRVFTQEELNDVLAHPGDVTVIHLHGHKNTLFTLPAKLPQGVRIHARDSARIKASYDAEIYAYDKAKVEASHDAKVHAYDKVKVNAGGTTHVDAHDRASVQATYRAMVNVSGKAKVEACERTKVDASGSSRVKAYGWVCVSATDRATVKANDKVEVIALGNAKVKAYDSVWVLAKDRAKISTHTKEDSTPVSARVDAYDSVVVSATGKSTVHAFEDVTVAASDYSTIEAEGNTRVEAYDSVEVFATDNAKVFTLTDEESPEVHAIVHASGKTQVRATGHTTVNASGEAEIKAYDHTTVKATGKALVKAYGNVNVDASGSTTVLTLTDEHSPRVAATVNASEQAQIHATGETTVKFTDKARGEDSYQVPTRSSCPTLVISSDNARVISSNPEDTIFTRKSQSLPDSLRATAQRRNLGEIVKKRAETTRLCPFSNKTL
ncbi:MAG: hypothetical protein H0T78_05085 [Longispora sp.]|nr:hypothetical protein [Longispora sp. (in: high G+C Gram-positive bacteria)]